MDSTANGANAPRGPRGDRRGISEDMRLVFRAITKSSTDLSFVKDADFRYICSSRAFANMLGFESEACIAGKTDYDLFASEMAERFRRDDEALFESGEPLIDIVESIPTENEIPRYSQTSKYILRDDDGNIIGLYGVGRDITQQLADYERLKLLTDNIPCGLALYKCSPDGLALLFHNEGYLAMTGYTREEYDKNAKDNPFWLMSDGDAEKLKKRIAQIVKTGEPLKFTYPRGAKNAGTRTVELWATPSSRQNDALFLNALIYDVTEMKFAEEALRESRKSLIRINQLVDDASASIYVCDAETCELLYVNKKTADMCGKTVAEARDDTCFGYLKGQSGRCEPCYMDFATGDEYTSRVYTSPDSGKHFMTRGKFIDWDGRKAFVEYLTDETDRVSAQKSLNDMINGIPSGIALIDCYFDGRIEEVYVNKECQKMISVGGKGDDQVDAYNVLEVVHPDDRRGLIDEITACAREGRDGSFDFRILMADESVKWINARSRVASKTDTKHTLYVVYNDIDQNKHHQLALAASYRAMDLAGRDASITFWRYDLDRKVMTRASYDGVANQGCSEDTQNVPDSLIASGDVAEEDRDKLLNMFKALDEGAEKSDCTVRMLNRETGRFEWLRIIYTRIYDPMYTTRQAIGLTINVDLEQDLNQRYEHELQLRQGLTRDSEAYFQLNLTTRTVEEYTSLRTGERLNRRFIPSSDGFRDELLKRVAPDDREKVENALFIKGLSRAYEAGESSATVDYRRINRKGQMCWLRGVATIIKRPGTDEVVAFVYCHDITREKKDQLALESILQEDIDAVTLINVKTGLSRVVKTNGDLSDAAVGCETPHDAQIIKMLEDGAIEDDESGSYRNVFSLKGLIRILDIKPFATLTHRARNKNGHVRWKRTLAYYLDASREDIVMSRRDITSIYDEEQRQKLILQSAFNEVNRANNAKNEFISRMSHDMRTAMNAVVGFVRLLKNEEMNERSFEYLEGIDSSSKFLSGLIQDILDIDGLGKGEVKFNEETLTAREFKRGIVSMIKPLMDEKHIDFTASLDEFKQTVLIDKLRFYQIITHLLSNAAKYTQDGGTVSLSCKEIPGRNGKIGMRFIVTDNGRGISEEFQRVIFEPFTQEADDSRTSLRGSGLGLAVVKKLLTAMGGDISVKSKLGEGSRFTVDFYLKPVAPEAPASPQLDKYASLAGLRVLIVEDNELNRRIIGMLLERVGCLTDYAENGLEATRMFAASPAGFYKAVLMDIRMPVMDGLEATRRIRASGRPDAGTVPVISVTADVLSRTKDNPDEAGITAQLMKPIDADKLFSTIAELTGKPDKQ